MPTLLRGITWAHTRGYSSVAASTQAFCDLHPEVDVVWERRSLWAFGEGPLDELVERYDLLVIDHPWIGYAANRGLFLPLDELVPAAFLAEQEAQSVGPSFRSYGYEGRQWALALDAAAQVAASRPDLLERVPETWDDVMELARGGRVAIPLSPVNAICSFLTLCANQGEPPYARDDGRVVERALGEHVLEQLRSLAALVDPACLGMNPIQVLNAAAAGDEIVYVPLTFGYVNYSCDGYAPKRLAFHDIAAAGDRGCAGSVLGGAGLAVSARTAHPEAAARLAQWLAGPVQQRTLYVLAGGQPGNRVAWEDELVNLVANGFFRATLATLDRAYLRPTWEGFAPLQTAAGETIAAFLRGELGATETLDALDDDYAAARAAPVPFPR